MKLFYAFIIILCLSYSPVNSMGQKNTTSSQLTDLGNKIRDQLIILLTDLKYKTQTQTKCLLEQIAIRDLDDMAEDPYESIDFHKKSTA